MAGGAAGVVKVDKESGEEVAKNKMTMIMIVELQPSIIKQSMIVTKILAQAVRVHGGPGGGGGASSASLMEKYFNQVETIFYQLFPSIFLHSY